MLDLILAVIHLLVPFVCFSFLWAFFVKTFYIYCQSLNTSYPHIVQKEKSQSDRVLDHCIYLSGHIRNLCAAKKKWLHNHINTNIQRVKAHLCSMFETDTERLFIPVSPWSLKAYRYTLSVAIPPLMGGSVDQLSQLFSPEQQSTQRRIV